MPEHLAPAQEAAGLRVLLVEDNPGDARLIEKQLEDVDDRALPTPDLVHVETLTAALDRLDAEPFDLVLLDLGLPESTGIDTAQRVIDEHPSLPVVVLTGLQNRETAVEAIRIGAQDYLNKNNHIDGPVLARAIRYAVERKAREQELELRTRRLEEFASVISHELRNPLNIARGYADLLREEYDESHLDELDAAIDRMDDLVDKLLQLSEMRTHEGLSPVDVDGVAREGWKAVDTSRATLRVETPLPAVAADVDRLRTLFEHLFRNAVEHGGDDVTVEVGALDDGDGFYVVDDGDGFAAGEGEDVFEHDHSAGGAGPRFGLAIVRSIVEEHGWEVRAVESEEGGARFEVVGVSNTRPNLVPHTTDLDAG